MLLARVAASSLVGLTLLCFKPSVLASPPLFTKVTANPIATDSGSSSGAAWADYDQDGNEDLFVAHATPSGTAELSVLYHNNGDGTFTKITTGAVVNDVGDSQSSAWVDYDRDGFIDLFVPNRNKANFLYHNNGDGTFARVMTGALVNQSLPNNGAAWADYDNKRDRQPNH